MKIPKVLIGTSGWSYEHWRGSFYPNNLKTKDFFEYYLRYFTTVEINYTFYKLPSEKTVLYWKKNSPKNFIFAIKASRYITHIKKLKDPKKSLKTFFNRIKLLKPKLGPILFQTPPNWHMDLKRLEDFIMALDKNYQYAFEFRDKSSLKPDIFKLLKKYKVALCIYDLEGFQTPIEITTNFVYIRLHGPKSAYSGSYSKKALKKYSEIIKKLKKDKLNVFCYFNNDERGYAVKNALHLKKIC